MEERTVIVSGASKSFSWTGGRIGWALFPTVEEAELFKNLNINYFSCIPAYNQEGARLGLESPLPARPSRPWSMPSRSAGTSSCRGSPRSPASAARTPGGFYVFPNVAGVCEKLGIIDAYAGCRRSCGRRPHPSTLLQMFLLFEYRVATMDRKSFGRIGTENMHYLRISIATDMDSLKEAVRRIGEAARDQAGFARFLAKGENLS